MTSSMNNIFEHIPVEISSELFETLLSGENLRIERIVSKGQVSPATGWYDQDEHEWVLVLKGAAVIEFAEHAPIHLHGGSYLNIAAHTRHKVAWTDPYVETVWLAIFYR